MKVFDSNCCLGKLSVPLPGFIESAKDLVFIMKNAAVDEALVFHIISKEYNPIIGNQKVLEEVREYKNLIPCWTILPEHTGEIPSADKFVKEMIKNRVFAVRIFPKTHNWILSEWAAGDMLKALEERRIPVFIDYEETDWNQLFSLCSAHPALPVVLTRAPYWTSRQIYTLLAKTDNTYIDTSFFQLYNGIEDICEKFGENRLLFGSAAPWFNMAPSVMAIRYAGISDEKKAKIAGDNLRYLIKSVIKT